MNKPAKKGTGYLSKEINGLIDQAEDTEALKGQLTKYIADRILESYKNGIAAGQKKASRE